MEKHSHNIHTFLFLRSICFGSQNMIVRFSVTWHNSHRNWTFVHCHYGWIDKKDNSEFSTAGINKTDNVMILKHWLGAGRQEECLSFAWFCIFHACNTASQAVFHTYTAILIIYPIKDAGIGNIPEVLIISASSFFPSRMVHTTGPRVYYTFMKFRIRSIKFWWSHLSHTGRWPQQTMFIFLSNGTSEGWL